MIRILHTADWHLGKRLHGTELVADQRLFLDWFSAQLASLKVDVVLLSGDVFDLANPSSEARSLYYQALLAMHRQGCQVVVTGGNHDSPAMLNAPAELLSALHITVVGQRPAAWEQALVPLRNAQGQPEAVVAAIPYLRDADLRSAAQGGERYEDRMEQVRAGIAAAFSATAELCQQQYANLPALAMGHLFAHGVTVSESEREIQVGNLAGFEAQGFGDYWRYVALGHIHRPQRVGGTDRIQYSGSPIALSFSEKSDHKRMNLLTLEGNDLTVESIAIPKFRHLLKVQGDLATIQEKLSTLDLPEAPLPSLLEVEMEEPTFDPQKVIALEDLLANFDSERAQVVKHRIRFAQQVQGAHQLYAGGEQLADLQPREVFQRRMEAEELSAEQRELLQGAFDDIVTELQEGEL